MYVINVIVVVCGVQVDAEHPRAAVAIAADGSAEHLRGALAQTEAGEADKNPIAIVAAVAAAGLAAESLAKHAVDATESRPDCADCPTDIKVTFGAKVKPGYMQDTGLAFAERSATDGLVNPAAGVKYTYGWLCGEGAADGTVIDGKLVDNSVGVKADHNNLSGGSTGDCPIQATKLKAPLSSKRPGGTCTENDDCYDGNGINPFTCLKAEMAYSGAEVGKCANGPGHRDMVWQIRMKPGVYRAKITWPFDSFSTGFINCKVGPHKRFIDMASHVHNPPGYTWSTAFVLNDGLFEFRGETGCEGIGDIQLEMISDAEIPACQNTDASDWSESYPCKCGQEYCGRLEMCNIAANGGSGHCWLQECANPSGESDSSLCNTWQARAPPPGVDCPAGCQEKVLPLTCIQGRCVNDEAFDIMDALGDGYTGSRASL